ncbi:MAG: hypothetical protein CMJ67_08765 [Planctomycetaceae bacterium]|nr:hypothetical protein [Planctomycetaceae bacterium]
MTTLVSNARSRAVRPGSIGWAIDETVRCFRDWRPNRAAIAFLVSGVLTIFILRVIQLPGGVLPALPVLLITSVPHSTRLLGIRLLAAAISTLMASVIAETFSEQPWMLVAFAGLVGFLAFYLLARGLDLLAFILVLALPVLYAWDAANGFDSMQSGWMSFRMVAIGLLVSGVTAILIMGDENRRSFQRLLGSQIRTVPALQSGSPKGSRYGEDTIWSAAIFDSHEGNLRKLARELGTGTLYQNLETAADGIRFMLVLHDDKLLARNRLKDLSSIPDEVVDLEAELDDAIKVECEILGKAFEADRIAEPGPDLSALYTRSLATLSNILESGRSDLTPMAREYLANLRHLHLLSFRVMLTLRRCTGRKPAMLPSEIRIPRIDNSLGKTIFSALTELFRGQEKYASLFATKATISMLIAFAAASVYSDWAAAPSLLLLAMLVTTVNQGALNISFIMRTIGLTLAALLSLLSFLVLMPDLDDIWTASLFLGAILLPGGILLSRPSTIAAGLNYAMGVMFIFSTSRTLQISLDPIMDRVVCVGGATLIPWLVFILIRPVFARNRISRNMRDSLTEIHGQWIQMSRSRSIILSDEDSNRIISALAGVTSIAQAMQNELGTTEQRWRIDSTISSTINLLFVLGRDLEFRSNLDRNRPFQPEELATIASIAKSSLLLADRVDLFGTARHTQSRDAAHRAIDDVQRKIEALEADLAPRDGNDGAVDLDRPGYLALLRTVLHLLRKLEELLRDREELLQTTPRVAIGA